MKTVQKKCGFGAESEGRVDRVVQELTGLTRAGVRGLFDHGCVTLNDSPCAQTHARAKTGDVVRVTYDPHTRYKEKPPQWTDPAYQLVHEDDDLLVVDKSPHVLTVATSRKHGRTLVDAIDRYLSRGGRCERGGHHAHVVHRLDLGVSGLLVFAKSMRVALALKNQFGARKPQRTYIAVVAGEVARKEGTFRSHLTTDASLNRFSTKNTKTGELAITHYRVMHTTHSATVVEVRLETGRRNQIRVHFAEADHPVLGDPRYRTDLSSHPRWRGKRIALHAAALGFTHPVTGKAMRFESKLPSEFQPFMRAT